MLRKNTLNAMQNARQPCCGLPPVSVKSHDSRKNATQREIQLPDSPFVTLQYVTWQLIKSLQTCYISLHFLNDLQLAILAFLSHRCPSCSLSPTFPYYAHFILWDQSCDGSADTSVFLPVKWTFVGHKALWSGVGGAHNAQTMPPWYYYR
jgi:hypothetical protein